MKHYHAPPELCSIDALYSDLSTTILTQEWTTPIIPLKSGVYQGDPLSVVVFNTVINSLVDTLQTHKYRKTLAIPSQTLETKSTSCNKLTIPVLSLMVRLPANTF